MKQLLGNQPLLTGFQESFNATSKRSQKNPKQLLKHHRAHMPQLTTLFWIQQNEGVWAKTATMGESSKVKATANQTHKRMAHRMFVKILECVDWWDKILFYGRCTLFYIWKNGNKAFQKYLNWLLNMLDWGRFVTWVPGRLDIIYSTINSPFYHKILNSFSCGC